MVVHGDDCTILGKDEELDWLRGKMQQRYTLKARGRLGPEVGDDRGHQDPQLGDTVDR